MFIFIFFYHLWWIKIIKRTDITELLFEKKMQKEQRLYLHDDKGNVFIKSSVPHSQTSLTLQNVRHRTWRNFRSKLPSVCPAQARMTSEIFVCHSTEAVNRKFFVQCFGTSCRPMLTDDYTAIYRAYTYGSECIETVVVCYMTGRDMTKWSEHFVS